MADWNKLTESNIRKRGQNKMKKGTRRPIESFYCGRNNDANLKAMLWDVLYWECGWSQSAIARAFGVDPTTVRIQMTVEAWEKSQAQSKKWIAENPESHKKALRKYFSDWDNRFRAYMTSYRTSRPEYAEDMDNWTDEEYRQVSDIYKECYELCQRDGDASWHVDHIVPYAVGGRHVPSNLRILPREDNQRRPRDGRDILRNREDA